MDEIARLRGHAFTISAVASLLSNEQARQKAMSVAARWQREADERTAMLRSDPA